MKGQRYDLGIFTSPAAFSWFLPWRLKRARIIDHLVLFLWDFFPIHQVEIRRMPGGPVASVSKLVERLAVRSADTVAVMSSANQVFLEKYHPGLRHQTVIIPPWSSTKHLPLTQATTPPPLRVIFGGQLAKGRGLDTLLDAAALLQEQRVEILIAGDGPDRSRLEKYANNLSLRNVSFLGSLPREIYRETAASAHIGVAITVSGVSAPTFPSKIVEYCSLGLPVIVCVEPASDAGKLITAHNAGLVAKVGDPEQLADVIRSLLQSPNLGEVLHEMSSAASKLFAEELSVESVVHRLENLVEAGTPGPANAS